MVHTYRLKVLLLMKMPLSLATSASDVARLKTLVVLMANMSQIVPVVVRCGLFAAVPLRLLQVLLEVTTPLIVYLLRRQLVHAVGGEDVHAEVVIDWAGVDKDVGVGLCAVVAAAFSSNSGIFLGMLLPTSAMAFLLLMWILLFQSRHACGWGLSRYESS